MELLKEDERRGARPRKAFTAHAPAGVECDPHSNRPHLPQARDALRFPVIEHLEIVRGETRDRRAVALDQRVDPHQLRRRPECRLLRHGGGSQQQREGHPRHRCTC